MADVVLQVSSMSLDGRITDDHDDPWANEPDDERDRWMVDSLSTASVHAMGSTTYRSMSDYWPGSDEIYAEPMNRIPKAVFSRTLTDRDAQWGPVTIRSGDTRAELVQLAEGADGPVVVHGGITFMRSLTALDAIDEYRLVVGPWIRGTGAELFQGVLDRRRLVLRDAVRFPSGALALTYRRSA